MMYSKSSLAKWIEVFEGGTLDEVVVQGAPEALDLTVCLRSVGSSVAMLDTELDEHGLKGVLFGVARCKLGAVVRKDLGELDPISDVEGVDHLQGLEHDR